MNFTYGLKRGLPIGIGYLAVSFAFGVLAVNGLSPLMATIISLTNLTSSGQYAGVLLIFECASYFEIGLTVLLINLRYSLMSISLSQKINTNIPKWKRLIMGFGITDEVYGVAISEDKKVEASYFFGLMLLPIIGWTLGTAIGAFGANFIPDRLLIALNIALYAMFIALIIPPAKKSKEIALVVGIAIILSCIFYYVPYIKEIGLGFKTIISTIIASIIGALVFPIKETEETIKEEAQNV